MTRQYNNWGNDQYNIESLNINVAIPNFPDSPPTELQEMPLSRRIFNYITILISLVAILIWWFLLGLFVKGSFPWLEIFSLIKAALKGYNSLWREIKRQYEEKIKSNLEEINATDYRGYSYLNKQGSEVSLLRTLLEILTSGTKNRNQDLDKILEILQKQEETISLTLKQLRKTFDPELDKLQNFLASIQYSELEADYKKVSKVLDSLVYKFALIPNPSPQNAKDLLEELQQIILDNPYKIDISRLETLRNVLQLLKWIVATDYRNSFEYEFKTEFDSARKHKAIELIVEQSLELLKAIIGNVSDATLSAVRRGIEEQWIAEVLLYGFNSKNLAVVELALEIDWNKFNKWRNYSVSDGMVKVRWGNSPIEINKITNRFNNVLESNNLSTEWRVDYRSDIDEEEANEINEELGFRNSPVNWDQQGLEAQEETTRIQDLSELGISLNFKPRKRKRYS
jgi:hypothetical protein